MLYPIRYRLLKVKQIILNSLYFTCVDSSRAPLLKLLLLPRSCLSSTDMAPTSTIDRAVSGLPQVQENI